MGPPLRPPSCRMRSQASRARDHPDLTFWRGLERGSGTEAMLGALPGRVGWQKTLEAQPSSQTAGPSPGPRPPGHPPGNRWPMSRGSLGCPGQRLLSGVQGPPWPPRPCALRLLRCECLAERTVSSSCSSAPRPSPQCSLNEQTCPPAPPASELCLLPGHSLKEGHWVPAGGGSVPAL